MQFLGRMNFLCRAHFFKVLVLVILSLMALQYGLSTAFYGGKSYFLVNPLFPSRGKSPNSTGANGTEAAQDEAAAARDVSVISAANSFLSLPSRSNSADKTATGQSVATDGANATTAVGATKAANGTSGATPLPDAKAAPTAMPTCPAVPPKLVGPVKVLTEAPSFEELDKKHPELELGGRFRPKDCKSRYKVAIIIPYRDREDHLRLFLHNIHSILQRQQLDYGIFVVEEAGTTKFNRAMLMNIGFVEALKLYDWQCFVFHDVDLLPEDDRNIYSCPEQPRHMSVAVNTMGYKLPYADIFGGVSALTKEQMEKVNGFSNEFWGWGGEDDDMANRIKYYGYKISRYSANLARYKMMKHTKDKPNPDRYNQLYKGKKRYKTDGINSLKYKRSDLLLKRLYTWVYVELEQPPK